MEAACAVWFNGKTLYNSKVAELIRIPVLPVDCEFDKRKRKVIVFVFDSLGPKIILSLNFDP